MPKKQKCATTQEIGLFATPSYLTDTYAAEADANSLFKDPDRFVQGDPGKPDDQK
jgi:hypothetical protein